MWFLSRVIIVKVDVNANFKKVFNVWKSCLYQYLDVHIQYFPVNLSYEIFRT